MEKIECSHEGVRIMVLKNTRKLTPMELSNRARIALLALLREYYGISELPQIVKAANGKPRFPAYPSIYFSLSHCKAAVMAAVADRPVGCDVEDIVTREELEDLMGVAFTDAECRQIRNSSSPVLELTRIWTRKEAIVKCGGEIIGEPCEWPSEAPNLITDDADRFVFSYHWR